jgi:hypothetical protein
MFGGGTKACPTGPDLHAYEADPQNAVLECQPILDLHGMEMECMLLICDVIRRSDRIEYLTEVTAAASDCTRKSDPDRRGILPLYVDATPLCYQYIHRSRIAVRSLVHWTDEYDEQRF